MLDTKQTTWYVPHMPELIKTAANSPRFNANHLQRGRNRAQNLMTVMKDRDPAMIALRLRTSIKRLLDASNRTTSPQIQVECVRQACGAIGTFLDIIGHPKRPAATNAKGLRPVLDLELPTDLVQMAEESNPPDSTEPETR